MKYWEIIADNLSKAGWSLGWVSACGFIRTHNLRQDGRHENNLAK